MNAPDAVFPLLRDARAIVTGGAQGLGLATARRLALHGARVALLDLDKGKAREAAAALPGDGHIGLRVDVTDAAERRAAVAAVRGALGGIDVLVNNAGVQFHAPAEEIDEARWRRLFDVNVHGMMFMSQEVGRVMLEQGAVSIVNIGSISSLLAMPRRGAYVTAKTAVLGITRALAVDWAGRGVRVNAVCPGYHHTPLLDAYIDRGDLDAEVIRKRIPMGHLGSTDDVGNAVVFFASPLSSYVTGQYLMVDGGYTTFGAPEEASH